MWLYIFKAFTTIPDSLPRQCFHSLLKCSKMKKKLPFVGQINMLYILGLQMQTGIFIQSVINKSLVFLAGAIPP